MSPEYIEFKKQVEKQQKVINRKRKLVNAQIAIFDAMLVNCQHEEVEQKSSYFEGSYYDKAYTDYWCQCKLCGKKSEKKHESHSWYG